MKTKLNNSLLGLLFISLCLSCTSQSPKNKDAKQDNEKKVYKYASMKDGVLHLDLNEAQKHPREVKLSDICDSLIYIPLETKKECMIGTIPRLKIDRNDVFINYDWALYHFNIKGKYIGQIGRKGRGPGEMVCTGFCIDKEKDRIFAYANYKNRFVEFNYNGKLLSEGRKLKNDKSWYQIEYIKKENSIALCCLYSLSNKKKDDYWVYRLIDIKTSKETIKESDFSSKFFKNDNVKLYETNAANLYTFRDELYYQEFVSDTIFKSKSGTQSPHIILKTEDIKERFTSDLVEKNRKKPLQDLVPYHVTGESDNYIFMRDGHQMFLYNKRQKQLISVKGRMPIQNDLDGTIDFKSLKVLNDEYVYTYIQSSDLLEMKSNKMDQKAKNTNYSSRLAKIISTLAEESNPVLVLGRLRK